MGQGESIGEIIRKKQEELKQKLEILQSDSAASAGVPVIAPPGMEGLDMRRPARKCRSRQCKEMHEKKKASTGTQTTISLPHTMREVLWTASSFEPMIDGNESEGVTGILDYPSDEAEPPKHHLNDEVSVGSGVLDLDVLSEENEEEEIKIHGMKADEFYAYIYMLIMILYVYVYDVDLKSRVARRTHYEISMKSMFPGDSSPGSIKIGMSKFGHQNAMSDVEVSPLSESNISKDVARDKRNRKMRLRRGITIDSGAGNSVMPRRMVINKSTIRESAGSRAGVNYVPAGGGKIPNEGEFDLEFKTTEGNAETWTFQVAEINKALGAVSQLVDLGYKVIFDKNLENGQDMSYMTHKATNVTSRLRRERNVWVLDAYVNVSNEGYSNGEQDFHRRG